MGNKLASLIQKDEIINYYISHEDEQKLDQISSNSLSRLEWYLNTYFTKKIKLNKVQEDQENALHIKHISYFSRAQQDNLSMEFLPNISYLLMYQHGSDMSSIISNLPTNVGTVSLNSDGVKSYSNLEGILDQYLQKKKAASMLFIGLVLTIAFLLILLSLVELNSKVTVGEEHMPYRIVEQIEDDEIMFVKIAFAKSDISKMKQILKLINEDTSRLETHQVKQVGEEEETSKYYTTTSEEIGAEVTVDTTTDQNVPKSETPVDNLEIFREPTTSEIKTPDETSTNQVNRQDITPDLPIASGDDNQNSKKKTIISGLSLSDSNDLNFSSMN